MLRGTRGIGIGLAQHRITDGPLGSARLHPGAGSDRLPAAQPDPHPDPRAYPSRGSGPGCASRQPDPGADRPRGRFGADACGDHRHPPERCRAAAARHPGRQPGHGRAGRGIPAVAGSERRPALLAVREPAGQRHADQPRLVARRHALLEHQLVPRRTRLQQRLLAATVLFAVPPSPAGQLFRGDHPRWPPGRHHQRRRHAGMAAPDSWQPGQTRWRLCVRAGQRRQLPGARESGSRWQARLRSHARRAGQRPARVAAPRGATKPARPRRGLGLLRAHRRHPLAAWPGGAGIPDLRRGEGYLSAEPWTGPAGPAGRVTDHAADHPPHDGAAGRTCRSRRARRPR